MSNAIESQIKFLKNGMSLSMVKNSAEQLINAYGREEYGFTALVSSHIEAATKSRTKAQFIKHMSRASKIKQQEEMGVIAV